MTGERCVRCGAALEADEISVTKKLINRGTREYYCISCLAEHFQVRPEVIRDRIVYLRETGCTLFLRETE